MLKLLFRIYMFTKSDLEKTFENISLTNRSIELWLKIYGTFFWQRIHFSTFFLKILIFFHTSKNLQKWAKTIGLTLYFHFFLTLFWASSAHEIIKKMVFYKIAHSWALNKKNQKFMIFCQIHFFALFFLKLG